MPVYLSASSIKDFIQCPQKVLYRVKKNVPMIPSKEMITGEIVHEALERYWDDRNSAINMVRTHGKTKGISTKDVENMEFCVDIFFLNFRHLLADDDKIEYRFKISLYDDVFLVGKMDRIANGNILDWKTSSNPPKRLDNDVQSIIYDFAYKEIFKKAPASVNVASLSKGVLIPYMANDLHTKELFLNIIPRMIKTLRNDTYERLGMFNHSCFRCPYKQGCLGGAHVVAGSEFIE